MNSLVVTLLRTNNSLPQDDEDDDDDRDAVLRLEWDHTRKP
jgi:hypothetical protein